MSKPTSIHSFMFPFRWDYISKNNPKEKISYSERTRLSDFDRVFSQCNTLKRTPYLIEDNHEKYNEYTYFHTFTRRALYDSGSSDLDTQILLYYELNGEVDDFFNIEVLNHKTYTLNLKSICLHIYNTGVGVLTFNLENHRYLEKGDILHINEFGRRIYPQFLGENKILNTQKVFLAKRIWGGIGTKIQFDENFSQYNDKINSQRTFLAPDFIKKVFGYRRKAREGDPAIDFVFSRLHENKGKIRISQVTDDRMFYICYYEAPSLANQMGEIVVPKDKNPKKMYFEEKPIFHYQMCDFWYCFVFGDKNDATIKNNRRQIAEMPFYTYDRWVQYNQKNAGINSSLFGMTRDTFVCIGGWSELGKHMTTMYYQMTILCLVQRASVLRFAYEVSNITELLNTSGNINSRIKDLYKNYIEFINKIYFREITSQIQGIEMYNQFQKVMNLEKEVKDLDSEIQELHTYVSMDEQEKLSKVAAWFLPAGVIAGLLGMNVFGAKDFGFGESQDWWKWGWVVVVVLLSAGISLGFSKYINVRKK